MYLYDIDVYGNCFDQDPRILDVPEFAVLASLPKGQHLMRYIVMAYDYMSPYRHMLLEEKKPKLIKNFGLTKNLVSSPEMEDAIKEYGKLQYDEIIDTYLIFKEKVAASSRFIKEAVLTADNFDDIQKNMLNHEKIVNISLRLRDQVKDLFENKKKKNGRGGREPTYAEENSQRNFDRIYNT